MSAKLFCILLILLIVQPVVGTLYAHSIDTAIVNKKISRIEKKAFVNSESDITELKEIIAMCYEARYNRGYINSCFLLAKMYKQIFLYHDALKTAKMVLDYAKLNNDKATEAEYYLAAGEISRASFNQIEAKKFLIKAIESFKILNNRHKMASAYNRMAAVCFESKEYSVAELYADSALDRIEPEKSPRLMSNNEEVLAAIYREQGRFKPALEKLGSALKWMRILGDSTDLPNIYLNYGYTYFWLNDINSATKYANKAYSMAFQYDILAYKIHSAEFLGKCYLKNNDILNAFYFSHIADSLALSGKVKDRNNLIMDLNEKYKEAKREKHRLLLEKENLFKEQIIHRDKMLIWIIICGLILVTFIGFYIYLERRKLGVLNNLLNQQNIEIKEQKDKIEFAFQQLKHLEAYKQTLTAAIVHDIAGPLGAIINIAESNDISKFKQIKNASLQIQNLSGNLILIQKLEEHKMILDFQEFPVVDILQKVIDETSFLYVPKGISIIANVDENLQFKADIEITNRILFNLISNAVKNSALNSEIIINANLSGSFIQIEIIDKGAGIPLDKLDYIFDKFAQVSAGVPITQPSYGLGLTFCKLAVNEHGGTICAFNNIDSGATFIFTLPCGNIRNIGKSTASKEKLQKELLSKESRAILLPFVNQLRLTEIYKVSDIKSICDKIAMIETDEIKIWYTKLSHAIYNGNHTLFESLLDEASAD